MHPVIIIGAGASGIAAALALADRGLTPLVLDAGRAPPPARAPSSENLYDQKASRDTFALTIGEEFEGLAPVFRPGGDLVKLTSPHLAYVTDGAAELGPVDSRHFTAIQSFARGGMANAWGAGLYRFSAAELAAFPFPGAELDEHFDRLTRLIGICGDTDDLAPYFGSADALLPPLRMSAKARHLLLRYGAGAAGRTPGLALGRPRTAVLSQPKDGRPAWDYTNLEFWQENPAIYNPRATLDDLVAAGKVDYRTNLLVETVAPIAGGVRVTARPLAGGASATFEGRRVLLAAGALNTARIVLASRADHETALPLMDNLAVQIPFVLPRFIGAPLEVDAFGLVQLNAIWESPEYGLVQGSLMEVTSPRRGDLYASLPYAARSSVTLLKYLVPAMMVMQLFFPGSPATAARIRLGPGCRLQIEGQPKRTDLAGLAPFLRFFFRLGAWTHRRLVVRVPPGFPTHYSSTLPMSREPAPYACDPAGELYALKGVHVADSAAFPVLPAKNMSFTMMAGAMRIAAGVADRLRS